MKLGFRRLAALPKYSLASNKLKQLAASGLVDLWLDPNDFKRYTRRLGPNLATTGVIDAFIPSDSTASTLPNEPGLTFTTNWFNVTPLSYVRLTPNGSSSRRRIQLQSNLGTIFYANFSADQPATGIYQIPASITRIRIYFASEALSDTATSIQVQEVLDIGSATMFQDHTGLIPVTAVGQPVGLIKDLSGKNRHLSQSVSTKRPTLEVSSSQRLFLKGNPISGSTLQASNLGLLDKDFLTCFVSSRSIDNNESSIIQLSDSDSSTNIQVLSPDASLLNVALLINGASTTLGTVNTLFSTVGAQLDFDQDTATAYRNQSPTTLAAPNITTVSESISVDIISLLSSTTGSQSFSGEIYSVLITSFSNVSVSLIEKYLRES
jgi:hypothetical protein